MVQKHIFNLKSEAGITLAEVIVSIVVVALFSVIIIVNFPQIQRRYALSNAAHTLAQTLRKTQDLALSGMKSAIGDDSKTVNAFGLYIDLDSSYPAQYFIYANLDDEKLYCYNEGGHNCTKTTYKYCTDPNSGNKDCVIELINMVDQNSNLYIKSITGLKNGGKEMSISFTPPNPIIEISNTTTDSVNEIIINLGLKNDSSLTKSVYISKTGLINVQ